MSKEIIKVFQNYLNNLSDKRIWGENMHKKVRFEHESRRIQMFL